jgi:hypothetical protein
MSSGKNRTNFEELVDEYKSVPGDRAKFKNACARAIADRTKIETNNGGLAKILEALSAPIEYQEERVKLAAQNPKHKPDRMITLIHCS